MPQYTDPRVPLLLLIAAALSMAGCPKKEEPRPAGHAPKVVAPTKVEKEEPPGKVKAKAGPLVDWDADRPFIVDVNGDGTEDILGKIQEKVGDQYAHYLAAIDGKDYKLLWKTDDIVDPRSDTYMAPSRLLSVEGPRLKAFELKGGKRAWKVTFPDKVADVFEAKGGIMVRLVDGQWSHVALVNGQETPGKSKKPPRFKLPMDRGYHLVTLHTRMDLRRDRWKGLTIKRVFCPYHRVSLVSPKGRMDRHPVKAYCYFPRGLAYAVRAKGSKVPFLVGFDVKTKKVLWKSQVTPLGSLEVLDNTWAELEGDRALFVYNNKSDGPYTMELVSSVDGKTLWSHTLGYIGSVKAPTSAVLTATRVYITFGSNELMVHDARDGKRLAKVVD